MTSIIKFQPISGVEDYSPPCFLLQVDDFCFLLECGLSENFKVDYLEELRKLVPLVDAVLVSNPDVFHLGALPFLVGKCGLNCPIYGTIPVHKMGQMFMYDYYESRRSEEDFDAFDLDDVDAAFDRMVQLRFNQRVLLKDKSCGISIVPDYAGFMIGGTIWKIQKAGEEDIVYAPRFNLKKEGHLNGCDFTKLGYPCLLITSAYFSHYEPRNNRDAKFVGNILKNIRQGNILIVADTAGRVLELIFILANLWKTENYKYPLCILSHVSYHVIEFAKSQIEWMSESLIKSFESMRDNPFQSKVLRAFHTLADINRIIMNKVVVVSMHNLERGFGRELIAEWSSSPDNTIVLTSNGEEGTLCRDLVENGSDRVINLQMKKRVKLDGRELDDISKDEINNSSSEEDDVQLVGEFGAHDLMMVKPECKKRPKRSFPAFPFPDKKVKVDEYGEHVNYEKYKTCEVPVVSKKKKKEVVPIEKEVPSKCVMYEKTVELKAKINFVNFEGRSDVNSTEQLVIQLRPRKLILIGAPIELFSPLCKSIGKNTEIFRPKKGEIINATIETFIYQISLPDSLYSSFKFKKTNDVEIAWVDATIKRMRTPSAISGESLMLERNKTKSAPRQSYYVNEVRLSDLKSLINKRGYDCELSRGVLYCCKNAVTIKRTPSGTIEFRGKVSKEFHIVKKIIDSQFAII